MSIEKDNIEKKVIQKLKTIQDIELPISIYDLGLIYKTDVELKDENEHIEFPLWIKEEVTGDIKYYNSNLMKYPYSQWKNSYK